MPRPLLVALALPATALAHPGGLDANGCHLERATGERHCHRSADSVPTPAAATEIAGTASVIDGDTIEVHGRRIRLHGIDAPESRQTCTAEGKPYRCGQEAALALADKIGRRPVTCEQRDVDRYGRVVGVCRAGGEDLNRWMVAEGLALAYRRYSHDYVAAELAAQKAGRGIWRGEFEAPWDWRRAKR